MGALADLYIEGGTLTFVRSVPPQGLTLRRVTDHFGPPEYFEATRVVGLDTESGVLEVYYPSKGLAFELIEGAGDVDRIDPDMRVHSIQYFEPGDLTSYFTHRYSCFLTKADALEQVKAEVGYFVQVWSGFGEVPVITEGPQP